MPLVSILVAIVIVGVVLWVINSVIPMQPTVKKILNVVVIIILCIWLLQVFGLIGSINNIRI